MATIVTNATDVTAPALLRRVSWGAVIAGAIVAIAVGALLSVLGVAVGATTIDAVERASPSAGTLGLASGIWATFAALLAMGIGGYVAARLSGTTSNQDGILHGLTVWALALLLGTAVAASSLASIAGVAVRGAGAAVGGVAVAAGATAGGAASKFDPAQLLDPVRRTLGGTNVDNMSNEQVAREVSGLVRTRLTTGAWPEGSRDRLNALVAKSTGISEQEASQRIDAAEQQIKDAMAQAEEKARQAADAAARATAMAAFWAFAALLLGAIMATIGACIGTRHAVYYRETYVAR
ncbi:MAG TPA: hypothetical protein VGO34_14155 [Alphaproteobacteria bacterium]|jgi:hypothetical protein